MACADFQVELSAWLDGESAGEQRARLAAHLQSCPGCAETLRSLQNTSALLRSLPIPRAPAAVTHPAMRRVQAMRRRLPMQRMPRLRVSYSSFGIAAAAVAAAIAVAVFFGWRELANSPTAADSQGYHLSSAPDEASDAAPAQPGYDFRDSKTHGRRDVASFDARERFAWEHGTWQHEQRFGRDGWWWQVGGAWYWYERPTAGPPPYVSELRYTADSAPGGRNRQQGAAAAAGPPR